MRRMVSSVIVALLLAFGLQAQTAPDHAELTKLLKEFLDGASRSDAAIHDRFWAEDLIYTGSGGRRRNKAEVMGDVRSTPAARPGAPTTTYTAEDIRIQQYGNTAIVAFRLVGTTRRGDQTEVANFLNSGTFLKRNGRWQVVNWQSTRMARPVEESQKEVAATEAAFHQALLAADVKKLESLVDERFIWIQDAGEQRTREQLIEQLRSGRLKYAKLETSNVSVSVAGDTAVVRGKTVRILSASPGSASATGDATSFMAFYTMTFINTGGSWKAVAMHSSRP